MDGAVDDVAEAIADPVRREILVLLRDGRRSAGEIAGPVGERFRISRPAVSRHLRVLRECGLVRDTLEGRRRLYALDATRLGELSGWLAQFAPPSPWQQRLDALETEVYRTRRDHRTRPDTSTAGLSPVLIDPTANTAPVRPGSRDTSAGTAPGLVDPGAARAVPVRPDRRTGPQPDVSHLREDRSA